MNIVQIQNRVQELPNTPQTMRYLQAAMNGQVSTVPPYVAAAELKRRETEGMMDQLAKGAAQGPQPTVKDQLEQKMGILALQGQQQPPQRPQIPQPAPRQAQPEAEGGIDQLPVKEDMFGMASGGIVAFYNGGDTGQVGFGASPEDMALDELRRQEILRKRRLAQEEESRLLRAVEGRPEPEPSFRRGSPEQAAQINAEAARELAKLTPTAAPKKEGTERRIAAAPAAAAPAAASQQDAGGLAAILANSPEFKRLMEGVSAKNPYAGPRESQADYIKRMTEGIRSQIPGGKMPWETSEARLKDIEARRAREDADYKAMTTGEGRKLDNLITFLSNFGAGDFSTSGAQAVRASQKVENEQREEALKRQDLRDQQALKLMEIRALNDQAQLALAKGNVDGYEKFTQEAKKLEAEFNKDQATLAKGAAQLSGGAREKDVEAKLQRERMAKDLQVAGIYAGARGEKGKGLTEAQRANIRARAIKDVETALSKDFRKRREIELNPALKDQMVQDRINFILQQEYTEGSPSPAPAAGGTTRLRFDAQGNQIK